jgi:magnesium chelatase family protein
MALARAYSIGLAGVQGHVVEIEADIENGLVALLLVGLPDTALREARDRIRSAIINSHQPWPQRRITVGLSPASLPKRGSGFDVTTALPLLTRVTSASRRVLSTHDVRARSRTPVYQSFLAHMPEKSGLAACINMR